MRVWEVEEVERERDELRARLEELEKRVEEMELEWTESENRRSVAESDLEKTRGERDDVSLIRYF